MERPWKVFVHGFHLHSRSIQEEKQPAKDMYFVFHDPDIVPLQIKDYLKITQYPSKLW